MLTIKKYLSYLFIAGLLASVIPGCSKDDSGGITGPDDSGSFLWVHVNGDSVQVMYDDLELFNINSIGKALYQDTDAIWLSAFIDTNLVPNAVDRDGVAYEARTLYAYRFEGDDGFSASIKGYPDNTWDQLDKGYILCSIRRVIFPDELIDLPGAYNVSNVARVRVNRKIDIAAPDTAAFMRLTDFPAAQVTNWDGQPEDAVSLSALVEEVVDAPAGYQYNLEAVDGYSFADKLTWEQLRTGYWLLKSERTIFTDAGLASGTYKMSCLKTITVEN